MHESVFSTEILANRSIVVTGASSGIGESVARKLAAHGARIVAIGRNHQRLEALLRELPGEGHDSLALDLVAAGSLDEIGVYLKGVDDLYGFVHCAGTQIIKPLRVARPSDFRDMYEIHVVVAAELIRKISPMLGRKGSGSIVLMSSVAGKRGGSGVSQYAVAKAAVIALTRASALEMASQGIRVNCLVPGMVSTPMSDALLSKVPESIRIEIANEHPLGIGHPDNVADAVTFLLSDASSWITGASIPVDGGFLAR